MSAQVTRLELDHKTAASRLDVGWAVSAGLTPYPDAVAAMETHVALIKSGEAAELAWLVEHPPLYTAGTSAKPEDLLEPERLPLFATGRGGQITYHGPGQRIVYLMLDVRRRARDVRGFVCAIEEMIIDALDGLGVKAQTRKGLIGVWVTSGSDNAPGSRPRKIAAIGLRVRSGVSFHGLSLNVAPNLSHYAGIVPCGIREDGVTSLADLGLTIEMATVDATLRTAFEKAFGPTWDAPPPMRVGTPPALP